MAPINEPEVRGVESAGEWERTPIWRDGSALALVTLAGDCTLAG